jgi:predicted nicotinamide N-methyase
LLPAAVGLAIMLGWTVPLEFGAGAGLAIVAVFKLGAAASGIASSIRAPRPAVPASGIHL